MSAQTFKKFLFPFLFFLPLFVRADHCVVSGIAIIPGPSSMESTATKIAYTVQSQTAGGESCHVAQTLRLSFSSSGTGSFTSPSGGSILLNIATNSANRNFYYENTTGESHILTVTAGYGTSGSWETLFTATLATGNQAVAEEEENEASSLANTPPLQSSSNGSSSHYSSAPLIVAKPAVSIVLSAGRDRIGASGSPMEFVAESTASNRHNLFMWNFGDGAVGEGQRVTHTYEFAGDYALVLNASLPEGEAVARANVKIVEPDLTVASASNEKVEIYNNSSQEVNLFGRALVANERAFIFPKDTIIKAGARVSFSSDITKLEPVSISEVSLIVIGEMHADDEIRKRLEEFKAKREIARLESQILALLQSMSEINEIAGPTQDSGSEDEGIESEDSSVGTATVTQALPEGSNAKPGWLNILKKFFLRKENGE